MRLPILAAAILAGLSAAMTTAPAAAQGWLGRTHVYEGRWCARMDTGAERIEEDCSFDSLDVCRQQVIAGNKGFCSPNPAYAGTKPLPRRYKKAKRNAAR